MVRESFSQWVQGSGVGVQGVVRRTNYKAAHI